MSLFKSQDFWSFNLSQLAAVAGSSFIGSVEVEGEDSVDFKGTNGSEFVVQVGTFEAIGQYDVFVCGNLNGLLCIIQIPSSEQPKVEEDENQEAQSDSSYNPHASKQLLLAERFPHAIIDLKCGCFVSSLKTSIAILSFSELTIGQPIKRQLDLLTNDSPMDVSLTFQLETLCRIDLPKDEIAFSLVTPSDCKEIKTNQKHGQKSRKSAAASSRSLSNTNPQKDMILVRYMNQFAMSLFDGKKLIGNFNLISEAIKPKNLPGQKESEIVNPYSHNAGPTLAAFVNDSRAKQIVVSLSDNILYCLPIETFLKQAKQDVVKRVALSLSNQIPKKQLSPSDEADSSFSVINLDLECAWKYEQLFAPVDILSLRRKSRNLAFKVSKNEPLEQFYGQILVSSRYSIDLISSSGNLLWSQRFEAQILCIEPYFVDESPHEIDATPEVDNLDQSNTAGYADKLMIVSCFDCLNETQSRLLVLQEKQTAWFSMLNSRPMNVWRMNLSHVRGTLASLDFRQAVLSASYLGTNTKSANVESKDLPEGLTTIVAQQAAGLDDLSESNNGVHDAKQHNSESKLDLNIHLEAFDQYPNTRIEMKIHIRPEEGILSVYRNLMCRLDYDDLLIFKSDSKCKSSHLSQGMASFQLGSCWPDQREPVTVCGTFRLKSKASIQDVVHPKSLLVRVVVAFNENRLSMRVQESIFHLPLTLIASLAHLDYTNSPEHSLADFQANLNLFKRKGLSPIVSGDEEVDVTVENSQKQSPYYLCDIFLKTHAELLHLVDELIESDLVCRGLNFECKDYWKSRSDPGTRKLSILENLNLLALSLNCRLKFKTHPSSRIERQVSEDDLSPIVMISIGLRMPSGTNLMAHNGATGVTDDDPNSLVWIHLCDMTNTDLQLPKDLIDQHMREWKIYDLYEDQNICRDASASSRPILVSIESEQPLPLLFVQTHLIQRLQNIRIQTGTADSITCQIDELQFMQMDDSLCDKITIDRQVLKELGNFIAISENFHNRLKEFMTNDYKGVQSECSAQIAKLKSSIDSFRESTLSSITLAKNLAQLSESAESLELFLVAHKSATSLHHDLMQSLQRLDELKLIGHLYSKLPNGAGCIIIDNGDKGRFEDWCDFAPLLD